MKKVLCSILAFIFVIGIFFSAPITIEAFAVENEVVEENTNPIEPDSEGIYKYQLTVDSAGYILHGPVINTETGTMHESITGEITLPTEYNGLQVVELADNAFMYAGGITSVTIPGNYKKIGAYVFCDTTSLTSVTLQDGVEEIGMYAFSDCSNLVNVTFPETVTKVAEGVLSETAYNGLDDSWQFNNNWVNGLLYTGDILIEGVEHFFFSKVISLLPETRVIASKAFYRYYASAEGIIIPETVDYIGDYAIGFINDPLTNEPKLINDFVIYGLPNTVAQTYAEENGITFSEIDMEDCFQYRLNEDGTGYIVSNLVSYDKFELIFPSEHNDLPVVGIGSFIISTNSIVRSVTIPDTITTIEDAAFYDAENLKEIKNLHDNLEIGGNAFYGTAFYNDQSNWENGTLYLGNYLVSCDMSYQGEFIVKDGTKGILADAFNCRSGITSVILPDSVEYIGDQAFYGCENLVSVTLGSNFRKVGARAFSNCHALKNITNTTNITQIGDSAFSGCGLLESFVFSNKLEVIPTYAFSPCGLTSISIPDSVKTIGYGAFSNCSAQSISIGQGVKTIGEEAFRNCGVESITIPASVEEIGENAFLFDSLKEIKVNEDNAFYCDVNGVLYNKSKTVCIFTPVGYTGVFEIGSDLTTIPTNLFDNRNFITNITVAEGNTHFTIEDDVLYNEDKTKLIFCLKNKSGDFVVPESVTTIGESAFENCTELTSVTLPDGLKYIGDSAFYGTKLTDISIPNTVETIGNSAFADNTVLSEITLPTSLQKISEKTFSGCTALSSIEIPDTVTVIEREAFLSTNLESIDFPKNLKIIGERAFSYINTLDEIVFPDSIETIENNAFSECSNLESVTIKSGNIWSGVFFNCSKLSSVVLQDGVKEIYSGVFENCTSITSITIPESVSIIGSPFGGCTGLTSVTIGATFVCDAAFSGCSNLYDITIEDTVVDIHSTSLSGTVFYNDDSNWNEDGSLILDGYLLVPENNIDFSKTYEFKSGIKGFARDIFQRNGDVGLTSVVIPGTIKHIPSTAFDGCWLESMVIEEGVETIGNSAVGHLSGNIYVPASVTKISDGAFRSQGIGSIEVSPDNENYVSVDGVVYTKDMKTLVAYPVGRGNHYDMPDTVESIRPGAVEFMHSSITFSDLITELTPYMFSYSCAERFVIPSGITEIPEYCFANNTYLKEIVLPSTITKIANNAFENCSSLETIILPENLEELGNNVFFGCSSLNDVNLADTKVTKIGESCFENCLSLESIIMPETLEEIPSRCFAACAKLNGVIFSNVSTIAPSAFFGCTSLLNAVVPETVDEIGEMALGYGGNTTAQPATYSVRMITPKRYNSANGTSASAYSARTMSSEPKKPEAQVEDFAIYGEVGSEAEKYAKANDFEFHDSTQEHVCVAGNWQYTVEPTCTTSGEKYKKCVTCGETMEEKVAEPTDHLFTGWVNTTESTCSKQGEDTKYCVNCGCSETQPASTKAHCYNESDICADCGINKSELVVLKPYDNNLDEIKVYHKDGANRIAITFSADTYIQNNDYVYIYAEEKNENQTYGDFTNNNFEDTSIVTYKNYYQVEYLQNKRLFVHDTDTVVVRLVTDGNTEEWTEPNFEIVNVEYFTDECSHETKKTVGAYSAVDCGSWGHTGKVICANDDCQKVFDEGTYIQLPHTVTNWTITSEATCYNYGQKMGICDVCGNYDYQSIDMLSHTFGEWVVESEPTCAGSGYKYRYCIYNCGTMQDEWTEGGHQGEWVVQEATCTVNGEKYIDCTRCNQRISETIWASHNYSDWVRTTEPTCSKQGVETQYCSKCGDTQTRAVATIAHTFSEGVCSVCNVNENDLISLKPYGNNLNEIKVYHKDGANRIAITFSSDTYLDDDDYVYIYKKEVKDGQSYADIYYDDMGDENESVVNYVGCYAYGNLRNKRLFVYDTDTVVVRLVTDGYNDYEMSNPAFGIVNVEYFTDVCEHTDRRTINQSSPTCQKMGNTGDIICANEDCQKIIADGDYIPELPHSGEWVLSGNSTCTTNAKKIRTCTECGTTESKIIPSLSHSFNNDGICTMCNKTQTECFTLTKFDDGCYVEFDWVFTQEGATSIALTFADNIWIEDMDDTICIYNAIPEETQTYGDLSYYYYGSGDEWAGQRLVIPTKTGTVAIRFRSYDGFKYSNLAITNVEYITPTHQCTGGTATCSERAICSICGEPWGEYDKTNHIAQVWGGTVGIHEICDDCGVTTSTKHTYKETIQDSTCTAKGVKTFACDCGYSYTVDVDKKAHTPTNGGEKGVHSKCKDCGAILSTQHTYSRSETQATCEKAGTVKYSCSCGYYYTETTKATGHNQNTKIAGKAATCTATGLTDGAKCSVCGKVTVEQKEIAKLAHNSNTKIAGKAATCTATGLTDGAKCSVCGKVTVEQKEIAKLAHNTNTKVPAVAATCTQTGLTEGAKCSVCGTVTKAQETVPATGHKTTLVGKKDATTKEAGYTGDQVCSVCNEVIEKGTEIPKIIVSLATPKVTRKNTAKGIEVSWNAIEDAENYIVYRSVYNTKTKKWSKWSTLKKGVTETSYVDGTVTLGTTYKYTVRAVNGDVMSKYVGTDGLKYNVKPTVKISNVATGVKVTWSTAANATGYTVYRSQYSNGKWSGWKNMGTAKANKTAWTDKNVKSGVQYKYTVRACYNKIKSSYKDSNVTIFLTQPTVKFANASTGIKVSWSKVSGATGYTVYRSQYTNGKWSGWKSMGTAKSTKSSWTDKKVESGATYKYTVRAVSGKYKSSYTDTKGLLYLAQPTVTVKAVSNGINVAWSQCDGATGYTVYRSEYNTKTKKWSKWKSMGTAKATKSNWTDKKATKGVKYKYTVRAVNADTGSKSTYVASKEVKR